MSNYYYGLLGVFKRRIPLVTFFGKSGTLLVVTAIFSSHGEHQLYEIRYIPHSDERNEIENDERYGSTTSDDGDKPKKSSRGEPRSNQNPTHNQIRTTHTVLYSTFVAKPTSLSLTLVLRFPSIPHYSTYKKQHPINLTLHHICNSTCSFQNAVHRAANLRRWSPTPLHASVVAHPTQLARRFDVDFWLVTVFLANNSATSASGLLDVKCSIPAAWVRGFLDCHALPREGFMAG